MTVALSRALGLMLVLCAGPLAVSVAAVQLREGDIVLADRSNLSVLHYRRSTGAVEVISSDEVGTGDPLGGPVDVALGPDDALYVSNGGHVLKVDPRTGARRNLVRIISLRGVEHSPYNRALYYLSISDGLWRLYPDGSSEAFPGFGVDYARNLTVGLHAAWVTGFGGTNTFEGTLWRFPLDGSSPEEWGRYFGPSTHLPAVAINSAGDLFLLWSAEGLVVRPDPAAPRSQLQVVSGPSRGTGPPLLDRAARQFPTGMALDLDGSLLVTTSGSIGRLFRVDPATGDRVLLLSVPHDDEHNLGLRGLFVVAAGDVPSDGDQDGVVDGLDNCPMQENLDQLDRDGDGVGDACNDAEDLDGDEYANDLDNCPQDENPDQADLDGNGTGDLCNDFEDPDGDDLADQFDNCPDATNPGQEDLDRNGTGDACNDFEDRDGDDLADEFDNCPDDFDPTQADTDGDGVEDACDPFPLEPDNEKAQLRVDLEATLDVLEQARIDLGMCLDRRFFRDNDDDGEEDSTDRCPGTPAGAVVDASGCSRAQFCTGISINGLRGTSSCVLADWVPEGQRDDSVRDCTLIRSGAGPLSLRCTPL